MKSSTNELFILSRGQPPILTQGSTSLCEEVDRRDFSRQSSEVDPGSSALTGEKKWIDRRCPPAVGRFQKQPRGCAAGRRHLRRRSNAASFHRRVDRSTLHHRDGEFLRQSSPHPHTRRHTTGVVDRKHRIKTSPTSPSQQAK